MPRPSITGETIVVQVEDAILIWTDGLLSSTDHSYLKTAKWLSEHEIPVDLTPEGPSILARLDDLEHPERALAAMMGVIPGRGRILDAPKTVLNLLPFPQEETTDEEDEENDISSELFNDIEPVDGVIKIEKPSSE